MRALIVGASAGVGRALSEVLAIHGASLLLVASNAYDLEVQAEHLHLVYGTHVKTVTADASRPKEFLESIQLEADAFGCIEKLFFPIGVSRFDDRGLLSVEVSRQLFDVNLLAVVSVIGYFLPKLLAANCGSIVGFGSIASIRGRRVNIVYAAAKRGLESYFESLHHLTAGTGVHVQFYKLGYVATQQSFGKKLIFPRAYPEKVASVVLDNLDKSQVPIYFPRYWAIVAQIIYSLPWAIFRRLDF